MPFFHHNGWPVSREDTATSAAGPAACSRAVTGIGFPIPALRRFSISVCLIDKRAHRSLSFHPRPFSRLAVDTEECCPIPCILQKMPRAPRRRIRTRRRRRRAVAVAATTSPTKMRTRPRAPALKQTDHRRRRRGRQGEAYRPLARMPPSRRPPHLQRSIRPAQRTVR
jgi:hypothetical protein